ncbi:MAG: hypothetical protein RQ748_03925 [Elusimicrobiales bacterium]|nr:hypothetical protein [Elusimicrobiales bacterium]
MKRILKKAGFPLLAIGLFAPELIPGAEPYSMLFLGITVIGGLLLVAGPFIPDKAADEELMREIQEESRLEKESLARGEAPEPDGVGTADVSAPVPPSVYAAGIVMSAAGTAMFFSGPNGVSPYTVTSFALIPGGVLLIALAAFFYGGGPTRRNMLRGVLTIASFLMILAGVFTGIFIFAGAFSPARVPAAGLAAAGLIAAGTGGAWYGMKYRQSAEGRAIGRRLGFADASGGGEDGHYDSKGRMNGVEVLIDVDQQPPHRHAPASFSLEVLCRCANTAGLRLTVKPEGPLGALAGGPPRVDAVPYWDYYEVRCDRPETALSVLPDFRKGPSVFSDRTGFSRMELEGGDFRFFFGREGYAGPAYTRRIIEETSLLASKFG